MEFTTIMTAKKAKKELNGSEIDGSKINVDFAKAKKNEIDTKTKHLIIRNLALTTTVESLHLDFPDIISVKLIGKNQVFTR